MLHQGYFDKVYYRFWQGEKKANAVANIFAIHGLGGHSVWFDSAAIKFNENRINFFSLDLPGFGQSKYPKGIINSYKVWIDITKEVLEKFLFHFEILSPVFILGHSLGALIAILLTKKIKPNGWILSVPGFEGHPETWPFFDFVFPVLCKSVFKPNEAIVLPFGPELLTKNKETQLKVKKDPYRVVNPSAGIFKQVQLLAIRSKYSAQSINAPVLILEAGEDRVCSNVAIENFFNKIQLNDKSVKIYTNSYHDLFIEDNLSEIVEDLSKWIVEHVSASQS